MSRQTGVLLACLAVFAWVTHPLIADSKMTDSDSRAAISVLSARWGHAVQRRDLALGDLVSTEGRAHYEALRDLALTADARELESLHPAEQLQVLLLRHLALSDRLQEMSASEILYFSVSEGLLGMDLRSSDVLREIVVEGDRAHGRLDKFGSSARPDRGQQTFVREDGVWRVDLKGEHERQQVDFERFVERAGLATSEASFFVLEMRLGRKITSADLVGPLSAARSNTNQSSRPPSPKARDILRLVAIRHALDATDPRAVTIEDRAESLRSVLLVGDAIPGHDRVLIERIGRDSVTLSTPTGLFELRLEENGPRLGQRLRRSRNGNPVREPTLVEIAQLGQDRAGLMAQWRNVGLRDRALLLQQGTLTPLLPDVATASSRLLGLRVENRVNSSFWHQIGLEPEDIVTTVNGEALDSLDAWQRLLIVAEEAQSITIALLRGGRPIRYQTRTIPAR